MEEEEEEEEEEKAQCAGQAVTDRRWLFGQRG